MSKKKIWRRTVSVVLSMVSIFSAVGSPLMSYAAEDTSGSAYEKEYPELEAVRDQLADDEIVTASDIEVEFASDFDPSLDFEGIEYDGDKVKITLHEAKNDSDESYSSSKADTYTAVYYVEPVSGNPSYQVSRAITVKEAETEAQTTGTQDGDSGGDESGEEESEDDGESDLSASVETEGESEETEEVLSTEGATELTEEEFDSAIEASEDQETVDEETGLSLSAVLEEAVDEGIELADLDVGETVTYTVSATALLASSSTSTETVTITRGSWYYYADYGLGSYMTAPYYVSYGDITATAYCVQPSKSGPDDGTYTITKLSDGKTLAKVCYYGTKASGDEGFFATYYPDFSTGKRFIITHLAAAYANGSDDAFSGTNETGKALALELYEYCVSQPDIPDVAMEFSNDDVTAYIDGDEQRTEVITFKADELQTITLDLPSGVKLHNKTTGETSKAGASVTISGGTKFYLTAPLTQATDVSGSWSSKMKGSITKDYSAYKISTGSSTQDLAFVFGEGVTNEKYVTLSVTWVQTASIKVVKVDSSNKNAKLSGAVFGIYSDADCTDLIEKMPATDENGASTVELIKTQDTVYIKEITAPAGYKINTTAYNVTLVDNTTTTVTVPDEEQLGELTIYKEGETLTGAQVSSAGVVFTYETSKLSGAIYDVYAGADIYNAYGTKVHSKGDLVAEGLKTGKDGSVTLSDLVLGTYTVKESQAPENYYNSGEEKTVTLTYAGQTVEAVFSTVTFSNDRQKAEVSVVKQDADTKNPLSGATFGLYAASNITAADGTVVVEKGTLIETVITGTDGTAAFTADLPVGFSYEMKELIAPDGYLLSDEVYAFDFTYTDDSEATVEFSHTFTDELVKAHITLYKVDAETGEQVPQGDATLEGAVYGLYARDDIVHPDGATGVIYSAGELVATLTTDANGNAEIGDLYLGNYYVKEITPPTGYNIDENEYDLTCDYEGGLVATVERTVTSAEQVIKQPFQVIKAANNGKTDADLLSGVGFTAYLVSSLTVNADGTYDFDSAEPVVITEDGGTEMFTDERGYACSIALPYGTYIVRETTTPHNYTPVDDFIVTITEHKPTEPQVWRVLLDDEFEAKLKIVKKDDETGKTVLLANTEFKVYDLDNEEYVEQVTTYPTTTVHTSYFTDENGYLILPNALSPGNYRIEEVMAPDGYTLNTNYVTVCVDSNTAYLMDAVSGDAIIEVDYENHPVKGELTIVKTGETLKGYDGDFIYEESNLAGAVFEVYAAEDIYTADHQTDASGNRILEYAAGTLVATVTTNENGKAVVSDLPLGKYEVKEVTAPTGFTLNTETQEVEFTYAGQDTAVVSETLIFTNDRQKVAITVEKQDAQTGSVVAGAVFGIYNAEDIVSASGEVLVAADTLLQEMTSGEDGLAACTLDLPLGQYYVKELSAPAGFVSSDEVLTFDASYQGQDVETVTLKSVKKNEPTTVEITKSDLTTGVEIDGAYLYVTDSEGNIIDSWVSAAGEAHVIQYLVVGETYTLHEETAPYGYLKATDVTFTISDTAEVQKVEMQDDVPTATLIVNKKGEFLDSVTLINQVKGIVEYIFNYITGNLTDVTFEVYAAEDIKAADGVSEDYYKADELVATITTDEFGVAKLENLPVGKYYVKEVGTAYGYVLDDEIRYVDLSYQDQDTAVVVYDEDWQNNRQTVTVSLVKTEKDTDRVLEGAIFGLYAAEDIVSASGEVLIGKDEIIELRVTDENGEITFTADLPIDATYYIKELYAPDGFVTTGETQEFTVTYQGDDVDEQTFEFAFENEATTVEITKTDLTTGEELPGAELKVVDEDGNVIDEWTSTTEAHVIKELVVGKTYTLIETKPADGYATAESIDFTIENTAEIQKVEMQDEVTTVEITKTDLTTGEERPGAELVVTDEDGSVIDEWTSTEEAHVITGLIVGKTYTLTETKPADGYVTAESIEFTISDTAEVQHIVMEDDVTKVEISKQDIAGNELPGAKLTILDENGNVVESWISTDEPHYIEKLPVGKYTLHEESAPDGYLVSEDVEFEVLDTGEVQHVTMVDEADTTVETPKTGDDSNMALWLVFALIGLCGMTVGAVGFIRRRRSNQ